MFPSIVMLHHVDAPHESLKAWSVTKNKFLELLNFLETNGYTTITFKEIVDSRYQILSKGAKNIILTFDDGPKNLLEFVIPELVRRKMKASFYIPTAHIGKYNSWNVEEGMARMELMNEEDIKEVHKCGMEVGSHSHRHIRLKHMSAAVIKQEVELSRNILEGIIDDKVCSFAFPYASVPAGHEEILSSAGYEYGLSIYQAFENKFALRRVGFYEKDTEKSLRFKFSKSYKWLRTIYDPTKKY